jgi:release factor glutamine methyltransferase
MTNGVYEPREDSLLLEKYVKKFSKGFVLDIGTGSGMQTKAAAEKADFVIGVDINQKALDFCNENIKSDKILFLKSDLFSFFEKKRITLKNGSFDIRDVKNKSFNKFDIIIFNPPYLPDDEHCKDVALDGGKKGYEVVERFLSKAKRFLAADGVILLIFSSFTNKEKIDGLIQGNGFEAEELERIHISFEDIYCYKITVKNIKINNINI